MECYSDRWDLASLEVVRGVEHIKAMRGGSQPHLIRCSDGKTHDLFFVVKFKNNPQSRRILANEFVCFKLARSLALPIPPAAVVSVGAELIRHTPALHYECPTSRVPCEPGLQFGSAYVGDPRNLMPWDWINLNDLSRITNISQFVGMLAFDVWACNTDWRQVVYVKDDAKGCAAFMIDQASCFNLGMWNFPNPRPNVISSMIFRHREVYDGVMNMDSFEPWLSRIQHIDANYLRDVSRALPSEWFAEGEQDLFNLVLEQLDDRRRHIPDLLLSLINRKRHYFRNWKVRLPAFPSLSQGSLAASAAAGKPL